MKKTKYDVDYFIERLSAIPDEKWTCAGLGEEVYGQVKRCVLGHLGAKVSDGTGSRAAVAFVRLMRSKLDLEGFAANDATNPEDYSGANISNLGDTPKERVLTALELIKAGVSV